MSQLGTLSHPYTREELIVMTNNDLRVVRDAFEEISSIEPLPLSLLINFLTPLNRLFRIIQTFNLINDCPDLFAVLAQTYKKFKLKGFARYIEPLVPESLQGLISRIKTEILFSEKDQTESKDSDLHDETELLHENFIVAWLAIRKGDFQIFIKKFPLILSSIKKLGREADETLKKPLAEMLLRCYQKFGEDEFRKKFPVPVFLQNDFEKRLISYKNIVELIKKELSDLKNVKQFPQKFSEICQTVFFTIPVELGDANLVIPFYEFLEPILNSRDFRLLHQLISLLPDSMHHIRVSFYIQIALYFLRYKNDLPNATDAFVHFRSWAENCKADFLPYAIKLATAFYEDVKAFCPQFLPIIKEMFPDNIKLLVIPAEEPKLGATTETPSRPEDQKEVTRSIAADSKQQTQGLIKAATAGAAILRHAPSPAPSVSLHKIEGDQKAQNEKLTKVFADIQRNLDEGLKPREVVYDPIKLAVKIINDHNLQDHPKVIGMVLKGARISFSTFADVRFYAILDFFPPALRTKIKTERDKQKIINNLDTARNYFFERHVHLELGKAQRIIDGNETLATDEDVVLAYKHFFEMMDPQAPKFIELLPACMKQHFPKFFADITVKGKAPKDADKDTASDAKVESIKTFYSTLEEIRNLLMSDFQDAKLFLENALKKILEIINKHKFFVTPDNVLPDLDRIRSFFSFVRERHPKFFLTLCRYIPVSMQDHFLDFPELTYGTIQYLIVEGLQASRLILFHFEIMETIIEKRGWHANPTVIKIIADRLEELGYEKLYGNNVTLQKNVEQELQRRKDKEQQPSTVVTDSAIGVELPKTIPVLAAILSSNPTDVPVSTSAMASTTSSANASTSVESRAILPNPQASDVTARM